MTVTTLPDRAAPAPLAERWREGRPLLAWTIDAGSGRPVMAWSCGAAPTPRAEAA